MNKYEQLQVAEDTRIMCNVCGKAIVAENGILKEDVFEATKKWGYFSKRDLEIHRFNICEACYDYMIEQFKIPVMIIDQEEVM